MTEDKPYTIELKGHLTGYSVHFWSLNTGPISWAFDRAEDALEKIKNLMLEYGNN
jgi:hypothetical protein